MTKTIDERVVERRPSNRDDWRLCYETAQAQGYSLNSAETCTIDHLLCGCACPWWQRRPRASSRVLQR